MFKNETTKITHVALLFGKIYVKQILKKQGQLYGTAKSFFGFFNVVTKKF